MRTTKSPKKPDDLIRIRVQLQLPESSALPLERYSTKFILDVNGNTSISQLKATIRLAFAKNNSGSPIISVDKITDELGFDFLEDGVVSRLIDDRGMVFASATFLEWSPDIEKPSTRKRKLSFTQSDAETPTQPIEYKRAKVAAPEVITPVRNKESKDSVPQSGQSDQANLKTRNRRRRKLNKKTAELGLSAGEASPANSSPAGTPAKPMLAGDISTNESPRPKDTTAPTLSFMASSTSSISAENHSLNKPPPKGTTMSRAEHKQASESASAPAKTPSLQPLSQPVSTTQPTLQTSTQSLTSPTSPNPNQQQQNKKRKVFRESSEEESSSTDSDANSAKRRRVAFSSPKQASPTKTENGPTLLSFNTKSPSLSPVMTQKSSIPDTSKSSSSEATETASSSSDESGTETETESESDEEEKMEGAWGENTAVNIKSNAPTTNSHNTASSIASLLPTAVPYLATGHSALSESETSSDTESEVDQPARPPKSLPLVDASPVTKQATDTGSTSSTSSESSDTDESSSSGTVTDSDSDAEEEGDGKVDALKSTPVAAVSAPTSSTDIPPPAAQTSNPESEANARPPAAAPRAEDSPVVLRLDDDSSSDATDSEFEGDEDLDDRKPDPLMPPEVIPSKLVPKSSPASAATSTISASSPARSLLESKNEESNSSSVSNLSSRTDTATKSPTLPNAHASAVSSSSESDSDDEGGSDVEELLKIEMDIRASQQPANKAPKMPNGFSFNRLDTPKSTLATPRDLPLVMNPLSNYKSKRVSLSDMMARGGFRVIPAVPAASSISCSRIQQQQPQKGLSSEILETSKTDTIEEEMEDEDETLSEPSSSSDEEDSSEDEETARKSPTIRMALSSKDRKKKSYDPLKALLSWQTKKDREDKEREQRQKKQSEEIRKAFGY
ncbi:uncharacterized protein VTP21DRAFT_3241 [Calcarisporiella thermophila]|uniref:uncharacterized protein n=1 Tax=Calcarisporiella thermophila TaxID=911321 RepID=UPI00374216A9